MITGNGPTVSSLFTESKSSASRELVINFTIVKVPPELASDFSVLVTLCKVSSLKATPDESTILEMQSTWYCRVLARAHECLKFTSP